MSIFNITYLRLSSQSQLSKSKGFLLIELSVSLCLITLISAFLLYYSYSFIQTTQDLILRLKTLNKVTSILEQIKSGTFDFNALSSDTAITFFQDPQLRYFRWVKVTVLLPKSNITLITGLPYES